MISKEESGNKYNCCYVCKKVIIGAEKMIGIYEMRFEKVTVNKYNDGRLKSIKICIDCWINTAGEDWCFEEEYEGGP